MIDISLTPEQKIALEARHKKARDGRERDRIKAVLLRSEGWSIANIAQALRKSEASITRHIGDYAKRLKLKPAGGGSASHLNTEQTQQLVAHLSDITYLHTHQIVAYIQKTWKVTYSVSGLNKWLHQNGFSYKQPKGVSHKFDEQQQAVFIEEYEKLRDSVSDDELILFMDAVHPTQATKVTSGWIRKGVDKPIETTGSRTRMNIVGAVRLNHLAEAVVSDYETVNGSTIMAFLEQVKQKYLSSHTIHLILDGAGYHRSKEVKGKAVELGITLHYLPPYSPNLNPIERLWKVMNEYARNNRYFSNAKEFRQHIRHFFNVTLPDIADTLNCRINDNFQVLIKPAS
jgi:transposase